MLPKVSILVPVYNVSDFIERCAGSLFEQSFDDIEYVFADDCTTDASIEKLQKLLERYVMFLLAWNANKISKVPKTLYHYIKTNPESLTKQSDIHFKNFVQFWEMLDAFFVEINIYEQYIERIEYSKVKGKVSFIVNTNSYRFRKHYAGLFRNIEMQYFSHFRTGEKLILFFTHYKMYFAAQIVYILLALKNGKIIKH